MLIAFEGGEGAGKGTQIDLLSSYMIKQGLDVLTIVEPGGTPAGHAIRQLLLHRSDLDLLGITEAFLFSAARAQQIRTVTKPALQAGQVVICDRSFYSTFAYQGFGRGLPLHVLRQLTSIATEDITPDLVILLDIPPQVGVSRKRAQSEVNRIDSEELGFHVLVREGYLELARQEPSRWIVIDATQAIDSIHQLVVAAVKAKLATS